MASQSPKTKTKVVDIHTHMYPPEYISLLESRTNIPLVRTFSNSPDPRLVLLDAEVPLLDAVNTNPSPESPLPGRPLTRHFSSLAQKLHFMDTHGIDISVISLANPWLDFLSGATAAPLAESINTSFSQMCLTHPARLYFFAALPLTAPLPALLSSIAHASRLPHCRGVILGTSGLGAGLDDPTLEPIFSALAAARLPIFLHPHYGLPNEVFGPRAAAGEYGHVLPLAIGFPVETTVAVARMFLAGVFDRFPELKMLLAHSGGTLPFLVGRIESCLQHDGFLVQKGGGPKRGLWEVLREQIYFDAVVYSKVALKTAVEAAGGEDRLMFGTDHPFFPPVGGENENEEWESVGLNAKAVIEGVDGDDKVAAIMGENAIKILRLDEE